MALPIAGRPAHRDRRRQLERYRDGRWDTLVAGPLNLGPISAAPDGALWFGGPSGIQRIKPGALGH
jgi:hypothetical protein